MSESVLELTSPQDVVLVFSSTDPAQLELSSTETLLELSGETSVLQLGPAEASVAVVEFSPAGARGTAGRDGAPGADGADGTDGAFPELDDLVLLYENGQV